MSVTQTGKAATPPLSAAAARSASASDGASHAISSGQIRFAAEVPAAVVADMQQLREDLSTPVDPAANVEHAELLAHLKESILPEAVAAGSEWAVALGFQEVICFAIGRILRCVLLDLF